jgi:hypothetical protein
MKNLELQTDRAPRGAGHRGEHPIPAAALDDRLGFIGTSGSGKTYNAGTAVEILLSRKSRVVIIDPLGVWWGLRLLADGKTQSKFDVAIFGGAHGDLPLTEHAGSLIGETAVTMAESCIIDLSELRGKAAERRFMTTFLDTIYQKANREPFHLVVDEADLFAPQKPASGAESLLGHMEDIVRRGRVKGFIPWLISQRPAVINKNVLSQVDGLLAFKLTSTQDRDALDAWIEGQADKAEGKRIKDSLPTLQIGQGIVWIPGRGVLTTASFPEKVTFDSSRTPKRGESLKSRMLKPLNLDRLKEKLAAVVDEKKANDPKALRSEIATLKADKAKLERENALPKRAAPDNDALKAAEQKGFEQAQKKLTAVMEREVQKRTVDMLAQLGERLQPLMAFLGDELKVAKANKPKLDIEFTSSSSLGMPAKAATNPKPAKLVDRPLRSPSPAASGDGSLSAPQLQMLRSLAWWAAVGHETPSRVQVAVICGWRVTSGHIKNIAGSLRTLGLIDYPSNGAISLTPAGAAAAPAPDTGATLDDSVRSILTAPQLQVFTNLPADGSAMTRDEVAQACGWEPTSGHVKNVLGSMRSLEVIRYPTQGQVARDQWLVQ